MTINSVGSSFDYVSPARAVRDTGGAARAQEAIDTAVDKGNNDWPPRTASQKRTEQLHQTAYGRLIAAQEEASAKPAVSSRSASAAYAR
ncbi:MAG: hypothetical protein GX458_10340 [Phyllobacteriaceae bacterium]|nr:hypothetical protein [Phyllobacteriaceae bacterium]